jgi:glycosyl transferase family 87
MTWLQRRATALRTAVFIWAFIIGPAALNAYLLYSAEQRGILALDFHQTLLPAAERIVAGDSPYPEFGYPPLVAFLLTPFAVVPAPEVLFTILLASGVPLALWILGVRDWRCYGAAFLWGPTFHALQSANVTIGLLVGIALCWRLRDRWRGLGIAGGLTIAAKVICWPLGVWSLATRRVRSAIGMAAVAVVVTFGLWAVLGFSGLVDYPGNIERLNTAVSPDSYTVKALAGDLGTPEVVATVLAIGLAMAALLLCVLLALRGDERRSFSFAVLAVIVASPIVWLHSFALLLAPLALLRPRFSGLWLLPVVLLFGASGTGNGETWQTALVLAVAAAVFLGAVGRWPFLQRRSRAGRQTPVAVGARSGR